MEKSAGFPLQTPGASRVGLLVTTQQGPLRNSHCPLVRDGGRVAKDPHDKGGGGETNHVASK